MKLYGVLALGLLLPAHASPVPKDIFARASDADLCKREDDKFWKDYDMKGYVEQQAHIQAIDLYQIEPNNPANNNSFFNLLIAKLPRPFPCTANSLPCNAGNLVCTDNPRVVKTIKATVNYIDFLNAAQRYLDQAVNEVRGNLASMQGKFNPSTKSDGDNPLSSLSAGMGVAGALASLGKGSFGAASSALLSIAAIAITEFGPKPEDKLDVKFDGYAALGDGLSQLVKGVTKALDQTISDIFIQPVPKPDSRTVGGEGPPFHPVTVLTYNTDPGYVSNVVAEGTFAVAKSSDWPAIKKKMLASLYSQVINVLWKREKVVVVRVSKKSLPIDTCDPEQPNIMFPDKWVKYCDKEGNMYVLQGRASEKDVQYGYPIDDKLWLTPGFDELGRYDLDPKAVLTSAWRNRGKTSPNAVTSKQALTDYFKANDTGSLPFFNLHTCDLDLVKETRGEWCKDTGSNPNPRQDLCTFYGKLDNCGSVDHGVDSEGNKLIWPWEAWTPSLVPVESIGK